MGSTEVRYLLDKVEEATKSIRNNPQFSNSKNNYHLYSVQQKYIMNFFDYYMKIEELIVDLEKVETFIRRFPGRKFYETKDINQLQFIKYHLEVFYHKIHTLLEVQKLAVNCVYEIGLKERDCSWENLIKHHGFKKSVTKEILDEFYKSFKSIIHARNLNTHRAHFGDNKFDDVNSNFLVYSLSKKAGLEVGEDFRKIMPELVVEWQIKQYRKEKIKFVNDANKVANQYVEAFKVIILIDFKKYCEKM